MHCYRNFSDGRATEGGNDELVVIAGKEVVAEFKLVQELIPAQMMIAAITTKLFDAAYSIILQQEVVERRDQALMQEVHQLSI